MSSSTKLLTIESRIGYAVSIQKTIYETIAQHSGLKVFQFYLGSKTSYERRKIEKEDAEKSLKYIEENKISVYSHLPLILNLAKEENKQSSIAILKELIELEKINSSGVLHIGKVGTLQNVISEINNLNITARESDNKMKYPLLLENAAGQGSELGKTWDELRLLFEGIDSSGIGFCFDTQHGFASGVCDFKDEDSVIKLFENIEENCGKQKLQLIHLNDSKTKYCSHVDRHQNIGEGLIWKDNMESFDALLNIIKEKEIDCVLETHDPLQDLQLIANREKNLCTKKKLVRKDEILLNNIGKDVKKKMKIRIIPIP